MIQLTMFICSRSDLLYQLPPFMAKHSVALSSYGLKFSYEVMKELKQPQGTSPDSLQGLLSSALRMFATGLFNACNLLLRKPEIKPLSQGNLAEDRIDTCFL